MLAAPKRFRRGGPEPSLPERAQQSVPAQVWGGSTAEVEYVLAAGDFLERAAAGPSVGGARRRASAAASAAQEPLASLHLVGPCPLAGQFHAIRFQGHLLRPAQRTDPWPACAWWGPARLQCSAWFRM